MVLGIERECNGVTDGCIEVVRTERQSAIWPDLN